MVKDCSLFLCEKVFSTMAEHSSIEADIAVLIPALKKTNKTK